MDVIQNLFMGFSIALTPQNLLLAFIGSLLGTLIGVLPGIGPAAGAAMLIPLTFQMEPTGAIILLTSLFYGTQYGGTITSVLMNVPGEAASAITCLDGYRWRSRGGRGRALHRGHRLLHRRDVRHDRPGGCGGTAHPQGAGVRAGGILRPDHAGDFDAHGSGGQVRDQGADDGHFRHWSWRWSASIPYEVRPASPSARWSSWTESVSSR